MIFSGKKTALNYLIIFESRVISSKIARLPKLTLKLLLPSYQDAGRAEVATALLVFPGTCIPLGFNSYSSSFVLLLFLTFLGSDYFSVFADHYGWLIQENLEQHPATGTLAIVFPMTLLDFMSSLMVFLQAV